MPTRIGELASMWTESYRLNQGLGKQEVRERKRRKGPPLLIWAKLQGFSPRAAEGEGKPAALQGYQDGMHTLTQGDPSAPSSGLREGVKKAAGYLKHRRQSHTCTCPNSPPRKEWLLPQGASTASHLLLSPWYLALSPSLVTPGDITVCYWTKDEQNKEFKAPQRVLI